MAKIKTNPNPFQSENFETAFWEAQSFLIAADAISKKAQFVLISEIVAKKGVDKSLGIQYAKEVNHAYAFELLLKCIMIIENGQYYSGHILLDLFYKLNPDTQIKLSEIYKGCNHMRRHRTYFGIFEEVTLIMVLEEAKAAFKDLRYLFEGKNRPVYDLNLALECLEFYIFELRPELKLLKFS